MCYMTDTHKARIVKLFELLNFYHWLPPATTVEVMASHHLLGWRCCEVQTLNLLYSLVE